jgi:hypothetical protein
MPLPARADFGGELAANARRLDMDHGTVVFRGKQTIVM